MSTQDFASIFAANIIENFRATPPAGIAEGISYQRHLEDVDRTRPCLIATTDAASWDHPRLLNATLQIELNARSGDITEEQGRAAMASVAEAIPQRVLACVPAGVSLRHIRPAPVERGAAPDGWFMRASWFFTLVVDA